MSTHGPGGTDRWNNRDDHHARRCGIVLVERFTAADLVRRGMSEADAAQVEAFARRLMAKGDD